MVAAAAIYAPDKLRHRHGRRHPQPGAGRDEPRRRHRRHHLHRLGHRLPEARRPHVGQADPAAGRHVINAGARRRAGRADRAAGRPPKAMLGVLADRRRVAGARRAADHPDRRRRHAGRRLDAQLLFGLGGGRARLHARQSGADHHRRAGRLVGRDPVLHHVQGHEPLVHLGHPRRLRRRDGRGRRRRRRAHRQAGLGRRRRLS